MNQNTTYSDEAIHDLKSWLQNASLQGHQKFYEVLVDGRKIIFLTENLDLLEDLNTWIGEKTKVIKVLVYNTKTSHRYQTFEFYTEYFFEEQKKEKLDREDREIKRNQSLSGFSSTEEMNKKMNETVEQALAKERHELEFKSLKQENAKLLVQTEKDNSYIAKLEEKLEGFESQRFKFTTDNIINVGSGILGNLVESNPKVLDSVAGLAGLISPVKKNKAEGISNFQGDVSFKMKSKSKGSDGNGQAEEEEEEEEETENEFDEETQAKLELFEQAEKNLNDEQYQQYFQVVQFLGHHPDLVNTVYSLLKDESLSRKKAA
ncbi:MAG: hypothetical protein H0W73_04930 [Bacteroidetes bacterium]|nr:hypothetical protein [Bacteroidota bacterium]